jgi:AcrR family transcriptional regulator
MSIPSSEDLRKLVDAAAEQHGAVAGEDPARARKRARLVKVATELFTQHGYRKASVEEIARRAGVAKGTLYLYFPTKMDLLIAALFEERKRTLDSFLSIFDQELTGKERLRLWLREFVLSLQSSPLTVRFLGRDHGFLAVMDELDPDYIEQILDMKIGFLAEMIEDACGADEKLPPEVARLRATVLIATFNAAGFFTEETFRMGLDLEVFVDGLCDVLIEGVCAPVAKAART